jgi:hypothetical protein
MEGRFAILNTFGEVIAVYEGDLNYLDISQYENYGGEIKLYDRVVSVGMKWNSESQIFE